MLAKLVQLVLFGLLPYVLIAAATPAPPQTQDQGSLDQARSEIDDNSGQDCV